VKKATDGLGWTISVVLMVTAALVYLAPHFGWVVQNVRSGSMAPGLEAGALVVATPVGPSDVEVNDVIVFRPASAGETLMVHRVVAVKAAPLSFVTKGDANPGADPDEVPAANVVARMAWHAPALGWAVQFLLTLPGLLICLIVPGLLVTAIVLRDMHRELAAARPQGKKA
jgi:signal peptidase I